MSAAPSELSQPDSTVDVDKLARLFRYAQIGRCVSSVTHDVNNLLGAIMAYAELVSLEETLSEESRRMLTQIVGAVRKSSNLINNLTDVARKERPDVRIVEPQNLVDRVVGLRHYDMQIAFIRNEITSDANLGTITVDLPKIEQAIMYVVANAIEAVGAVPNKSIAISLLNQGSHVEIVVRDSAPAIASDLRTQIFEPFYTTKGGDHLGLGLFIARNVMAEHDGEITYDPQRGFVMRLPRVNSLATGVASK